MSLIFLLVIAVAVILVLISYWKIANLSGQTQGLYSAGIAFPQLSFNQPVGISNAHDGSNRLFIIEQPGVIRVFENSQNTTSTAVFLDISTKVLYGGEQGLLGLAFHPNYTTNGYFYVNYVADNPSRTIVARYSVSPSNPNQAVEDSELILLEISQPFSNHKGGQTTFGPDGYLYIGLGDGGSEGDPYGNAQNRSTLLGKILRINVDLPTAGKNYSIPPDNPFYGSTLGYKEEIYAYGLRNPWRFSFDQTTGGLWVGDVGGTQLEEIDIVEKGKNYGWNIMEGSLPFLGGNESGLELPVWEYGHDQGIAIIGGSIYHGSALANLSSKYIYGDLSGKIWALQYDPANRPVNTLLVDTKLEITSFGIDEQNNLYFCALNGKLYTLSAPQSATPSPSIPEFSPIIFLPGIILIALAALLRKPKKNLLVRASLSGKYWLVIVRKEVVCGCHCSNVFFPVCFVKSWCS